MTDSKATGFDKATGGATDGAPADDDQAQSAPGIPRAMFTKENTIDLTKLQIPQLRLAQGTTAEVGERKASIGQYVLSNFKAYDEVVVIPLGAAEIRVYKPDPKAPAACHAPTGTFGFGTPGGDCSECPLAKWGEYNEATKKSTPPKCKDGILIRAYSVTHRSMVDFQFLGGDRSKGGFIQQQGMNFGWSGFAVKMTSAKKENAKGTWYIPEMEMLDGDTPLVPDEQREIAERWYEIFCQSQLDTREQALAALQSGEL